MLASIVHLAMVAVVGKGCKRRKRERGRIPGETQVSYQNARKIEVLKEKR